MDTHPRDINAQLIAVAQAVFNACEHQVAKSLPLSDINVLRIVHRTAREIGLRPGTDGLVVSLLQEVVPGGIGEKEFAQPGGWRDRATQALANVFDAANVAAQPFAKVYLTGTHEQQVRNIARDLEGTALGDSFFGEALAQAGVLPCVTEEDKALLSRYIQGTNAGTDHVALQDLANRIYAFVARDSLATTTDH